MHQDSINRAVDGERVVARDAESRQTRADHPGADPEVPD